MPMPIHDWTRVEAGIYHHFHGRWLYAMADALNLGVLPKGYYALAEQITRTFGPDVQAGQRRLSIRHVSDHQMVALIELVSPSNKASTASFDSFVQKACGVLNEGIHLIVIDPFPPTKRDPNGIHAAIWEAMTEKAFTPPTRQTTHARGVLLWRRDQCIR